MAASSRRVHLEAPAQIIPSPTPAEAPPAPEANAAPLPEPMNRYIHPIPQSARAGAPLSDPQALIYLEQLLETLMRQNQLLLDLLAAVNSLSAAVLTPRPDTQGSTNFS